MKTNQLKKILKPLIKQTVKEILLEEGVLSSVVMEVARGLQSSVLTEAPSKKERAPEPSQDLKEKRDRYEANRQERIRRLNESADVGGVDVFSGVPNIPDAPGKSGPSTFANVASDDRGVDISDIQNLVGNKWRDLI